MLLAYRENPSFFAVAHALGVHHQTVQRCVERALAYGPMAALDDRPRSGKGPTITAEAKAWLVSLASRKAKELGYPTHCWLAMPACKAGTGTRLRCRSGAGHGVQKSSTREEVKAQKVQYYLEQRDSQTLAVTTWRSTCT
jgi:transposase